MLKLSHRGNPFRIGFRTIKTAVGVALAISLAQYFQLEFYVSAGIITILCIQATKRSSVRSSLSRFAACLIGIVLSIIFFEGIGYTPLSVGLLLLLFIPLCVLLQLKDGIVTSTVIIFHLYTYQTVDGYIVLNELALITIGIGVALLMNVYIPSVDKQLKQYQKRIETNFKKILEEFAFFLRDGNHLWDGKEITETSDLLKEAQSLAFKKIENHFLRNEDKDYHYLKMREKQFEILMDLMPILSNLDQTLEQGLKLSDFLEELSAGVHRGNTASIYLERLAVLREEIGEMSLPETRKEFETRAHLFYLLNQIERYLKIKNQFKVG
ncbi:aromatic acid exporter family protein [Bacillus horti]|uniref:Uncharacterized membrane protein YgaE (UPF0421/DUF939 family) n=1 Tax=Caldalkalibacillus horti TaxID=77523 RepID=A0ABT9W4F1_9BACI|nr:aromatic acid exporter family protein [Bacillus horti]MDQ0168127.1 uncharacterized membrane protein YgaE (UPF0421/DUF939 family) [Bacillus horti]